MLVLMCDFNIGMKDHRRKNHISTQVNVLLLEKQWTGSNFQCYFHCINSVSNGSPASLCFLNLCLSGAINSL